MKDFHAYDKNIDGTFGMEVDATSKAYKELKKRITRKTMEELYPDHSFKWWGDEKRTVRCAPAVWVAAILREEHWLITERKAFGWFYIDGGTGEDIGSCQCPIYIDYTEGSAEQ